MLLLLSCCMIAGIATEAPPVVHYGLKDGSVCLHVRGAESQHVNWRINSEIIVIDGTINKDFKEKVDYNPANHSLCIKKLTEKDSGAYTINLVRDFRHFTVTHMLIVQETVPRPVMRMTVLHSNVSDGFCNITVNCSVQDNWAWSVCDEGRCRTSQWSVTTVNITISSDNGTIECNGNNRVSMKTSSQHMMGICFHTNTKYTDMTLLLFFIIIGALLLFTLLCVLIGCLAKRFSRKHDNHGVDTVTQVAEAVAVAEQPSTSQAKSIYENVEDTHHIQASNTTITPNKGAGSPQPPDTDTVYCLLQLPVVNAPLDKSGKREDMRRHKKMQEATATSEAEGTLAYNIVQDEAQNQPLSATGPTHSENRGSDSEKTGKPSFVLDVSVSRDAEAVQRHQEDRGESLTLEERERHLQTETVYSVVQKRRALL